MQNRVTITVSSIKLEEIEKYYLEYIVPNDGDYVLFLAKKGGVTITAFTSKKADHKVTFVGANALDEALLWDETATLNETKEQVKEEWLCLDTQIGSDEVGVGDFLLPMIVVAAFVRKKDLNILKEYGVHDSKKLKDKDILEIGEALSKKFFISRLTLSNEKYNEMIDKGENMNSLKAKMHNRALLNLYKQFPDTKYIFVDQFVNEDKYYSYLNDKNEKQVVNIVFKTKGESFYPCVALASVMARYCFLLEKEKLEKHYKMEFPLGANKKVDEFAKAFIAKFGAEEFTKIAKKNFANYRKAFEGELL